MRKLQLYAVCSHIWRALKSQHRKKSGLRTYVGVGEYWGFEFLGDTHT